ncbi:MAG: mycofactocin biosynthesis glycosyltransferase MftF [Mycobacteriales bacterium]|nr:mycofactocin biosynthesis glycosyltransferase MftF [Mycobacteriales bacterium]
MHLDPRVRRSADGRVLLGGDPGRLLRLGPTAGAVLAGLAQGRVGSQRLARTLLDGGLAHPRPRPAAVADVTVVVPVKDRAAELDGCLTALGRAAPVVVVDDGSLDPAAVAAVVARHGARLVRRETCGGPGAARTSGLAHTGTAYAAFVDSDCRPPADWLSRLLGHLADPAVAAVAPRVVGTAGPTVRGRVSAARSPLDLGAHPARVRPGGAVAYVPTAALLVRVAALPEPAFDPALRYGEDVDLAWRLHDAGWTVRYDPSVEVAHVEPETWRGVLTRRFRYGTSAAPLATRHGVRLTHLVLRPWPTAVVALLLTRRPGPALLAAAVPTVRLARQLDGLPGEVAAVTVAQGVSGTAQRLGRVLGSLAPLLVRGRTGVALAVLPHVVEWARLRPPVDPVRWTAVRAVDELAYGLGVWAGALRHRTARPLLPSLRRPD